MVADLRSNQGLLSFLVPKYPAIENLCNKILDNEHFLVVAHKC